ncbi:FG-GAP repeat domain-containing protein [Ottowia thiooxydans]|uniref:FG-GAP repeat domain-containing protein n=1 Tax=Ottowia thiooxydans TaxID=219182 RepID=UPI00048A6E6D|nr:VCBS repeat-containing protein [Ottowia thiooxydans]
MLMRLLNRAKPFSTLLAGALIWMASCTWAWAAVVSYDILLDTDANSATGCTVSTPKGNFQGVEQIFSTQVITSTTGASVTGVTRSACASGTFSAPQTVDVGGWPVGFGLGVDGVAIIETYAPLALLGTSGNVRAGVVSRSGDDSDAILGVELTLGSGIGTVPIPTITPPVLLLLAAAIAWLAGRMVRRRGLASVLMLGFVLAGSAGVVWAATIALDGLAGDWAGQQPRATAPKGDAPVNVDLTALWFTKDGTRAYFRIDADVVVAAPALTLGPLPDRSIPAGQPWSLRLAADATDPTASLNYQITQGPAGAQLAPEPMLRWTPTPGQAGTVHSFTVAATDGTRTAQATFNVTVTAPVNQPPAIDDQVDEEIPVGSQFQRAISASDPEGAAVTLTLQSGPPGASLSGTTLSWGANSQPDETAFVLRASDPQGASSTARFFVRTLPSAPPLALNDEYTVRLGQTFTLPATGVLSNDVAPSGGTLTAGRISNPDKGTLNAFNADGSFTYQAPAALPPAPPFKMALDWSDPTTGGLHADSVVVADLNGDGVPDIVRADSAFQRQTIAYNGANGSKMWETGWPFSGIASDCQLFLGGKPVPVVADIDDNGTPEVMFPVDCGRDHPTINSGVFKRVIALNGVDGTVRWLSDQIGDGTPPGDSALLNYTTLTVSRLEAGGPVLVMGAHTELDPSPNTACQYIGGEVAHKRCRRVFGLDGRDGSLVRNWYAPAPDYTASWPGYRTTSNGMFEPPFVSDIDGDGHIEILYEGTLWRENGTFNGTLVRHFDGTITGTPQRRGSQQFGVGDLDGDGRAEIVIADQNNSLVRAQRPDGSLLWETEVSHCSFSCVVSIADVDGDGAADVLLAGGARITLLDGLGRVRWARSFIANYPLQWSYGCANRPAVYDLDGDGVPEVVVRVSKYIRALRGDTGELLDELEIPTPSGSLNQTACGYSTSDVRVVDQRGDGAARLVFPSAYGFGFAVLKSANDPWMPVRKRYGSWVDQPGAVTDSGHVNVAGPAPGMGGRPNVFGQQVQQATRADLRNRERTSFTYEARAGTLASAPATVRLNLLPSNGKPRITSVPPMAWQAGAPANFSYNLAAVDPDAGDTLTWSIVSYEPISADNRYQPVINPSTGAMTQNYASSEQYLYTVRVTDSQGAYADQMFSVNFSAAARVAVPNVVGQSRNAAFASLAAVRLLPGTLSEQFSDNVPVGTVMIQTPASGQASVGAGIHLTFSKGPEPRPVPNVVGSRLEAAGVLLPTPFSLGTVNHVYSSTVEQGRILSQLPAAGEQAVPGAVAVTVSGGTGLSLHLNRDYSSADLPITFTAKATAPDGSAQSLPSPINYSVTELITLSAGPLPTVSGNQIIFGNSTRGSFRLTASGGGRTTSINFAVGPPAAGGEASPMVEYVQLMQTLQGVYDLMEQAKGQDVPTARALLTQAVNLWRSFDRDALRLTSPMVIEGGFLPTLADLTAAGVVPGPQDALNKQMLRESIAPLKALTAGLRERNTPLTQIDLLGAAFDTKARRVSGLVPSEYGTVQAAPEYTLIVSHAIPDMMDALMNDFGEGLGIGRETRPFPLLKSSLVESLTTLAIDQALSKAMPLLDSAKKYARDILGQAAYGAAAVALANHARQFLGAQELIAVGSGASMSMHVFESPWAFIEARGLEWEYTDLNTVVLLGPDLLSAASDAVDKIKAAWKATPGSAYTSSSQIKKDMKELKGALQGVVDAAGAAAEVAQRSFQGTDEEAEACLFDSHPDCTQLLFSDGFDSVYHYTGPTGGTGLGGLPVPITFIVRNNVSGQLYISTPVFLPTPKP